MIQLTRTSLSLMSVNQLQVYQHAVDAQTDYPAKVAFAKEDFPKKNVSGNRSFDEIKLKLIEMCNGAERCHYCEDSKADEVEHFYPKDVFPEHCYNWDNYFYICGSCNIKKNNKCAIINADEALINITPARKKKNNPASVPIQPVVGQYALVNPETENPLDFFLLDLRMGSFNFAELPDEHTTAYKRAKYTLETLKLNSRAFLIKGRKQAYGDFKARLTEYIFHKNQGSPIEQINSMIEEIRTHNHPTVWKEMIRQREYIRELQLLFHQAPEAIHW